MHAELFRQPGGDHVEVAEQVSVRLGDIGMRRDHLVARDDEHVNRRLRVDVAERQAAVVLVHDVRGDLSVDDLLEEVVLHHGG